MVAFCEDCLVSEVITTFLEGSCSKLEALGLLIPARRGQRGMCAFMGAGRGIPPGSPQAGSCGSSPGAHWAFTSR